MKESEPIACSKVSKNKMVWLPDKVRKILNIDTDEYVGFFYENGDIIIRKVEVEIRWKKS